MGRTYVMSDIHGMAELFKRMLEKIKCIRSITIIRMMC